MNYAAYETRNACGSACAALTRAAEACDEAKSLAVEEPGAALDALRRAQSWLDDANGALAEAMRAARKAATR